jgi:hypothetical protein
MAPVLVFLGVPPQVPRPQPLSPRESGSGDVWFVLARFSRLITLAHQLEVGGGRGRVHVLTGHNLGEVTA